MRQFILLVLVAALGSAAAQEPQPLAEAGRSTIGFRTAAEALQSLRADPAVVEREQQGWLLFKDEAHHTLWSFAPQSHPAYPAAIKREIIEKNGALYVNMSVQCEARKKACDQLVRDFQVLNEQMGQAMRSGQAGQVK